MTNIELEALFKKSIGELAARVDTLEAKSTIVFEQVADLTEKDTPPAPVEVAARAFQVGDRVRVTSGDWGNNQGYVTEIDDTDEPIATVLINGWQEAYISAALLQLSEDE